VSARGIAAGVLATLGVRSGEDERGAAALRAEFGAEDVLLTDSGTSALVIAMRRAAGVGTVALPAFGCPDLAAAAVRAAVRVRLYDLDPLTMSPDLDSVRAVLTRGVDAVVVAHFYGYPADVHGVQRCAAEHGVAVIEDAAQGASGALLGARLGSIADEVVLSFGRGKGMTAGSGGALLSRRSTSRNGHRQVGAARTTGREVAALCAQWALARPSLYRLPTSIPMLKLGESVYHPAEEPRAMSATAAAMLPNAIAMERGESRTRRENAGTILGRIDPQSNFIPVRSIGGGAPGYLRCAVIDGSGRAAPSAEIGALRTYPKTLDEHPQLQPMLAAGERAGRGAMYLRDRLYTLPTQSRVTTEGMDRIVRWLRAPAAT
jgi:perosamine synthetase